MFTWKKICLHEWRKRDITHVLQISKKGKTTRQELQQCLNIMLCFGNIVIDTVDATSENSARAHTSLNGQTTMDLYLINLVHSTTERYEPCFSRMLYLYHMSCRIGMDLLIIYVGKKFGCCHTHTYLLVNKIKEVSFNIIHKYYPANQYMKKFKENINSNCSFCNDHPETVLHLFWHCIHVRKLWQDISRFLI